MSAQLLWVTLCSQFKAMSVVQDEQMPLISFTNLTTSLSQGEDQHQLSRPRLPAGPGLSPLQLLLIFTFMVVYS